MSKEIHLKYSRSIHEAKFQVTTLNLCVGRIEEQDTKSSFNLHCKFESVRVYFHWISKTFTDSNLEFIVAKIDVVFFRFLFLLWEVDAKY